jgi:isoleucyl-tRNA synthetase
MELHPAGKPESSAMDYKSTLNLPSTDFSMKANLTQREPVMLAKWQSDHLYEKILASPHPRGKWVLHDGPPYANGDIHMGHLINKVLKDIIIKYRTMSGYECPYVPGWDCHGLPIESAVQKELGPKLKNMSPFEVRKLCRDYAMKFVGQQAKSFQRLGVLADYEKPYLTLAPAYEKGVLQVLAELLQHELVFRQRRPVHWCTYDQTALAEAELEYAPHQSTSVFVAFAMDLSQGCWPGALGSKPANAAYLIWTTTPWTLPANRAVAVGPGNWYVCLREKSGRHPALIVARERAQATIQAAAEGPLAAHYEITANAVLGTELEASAIPYRHPFDENRTCPVVCADYVTLEDGTGLVHTAPGHGAEDYLTGRRCNLEVYSPVLPDGRYDESVAEYLRGELIWDANEKIVNKLTADGQLIAKKLIQHSYPHCWRCRRAIIFRATEQWFVRASNESPLVQRAQEFINHVQWIPAWGKSRIAGMLSTRPDWCISRQRSWGVPIPAFTDAEGNILLTAKSTARVAEYFGQHGADSWYTDAPEAILGTEMWCDDALPPNAGVKSQHEFVTAALRKGSDILDVWFESGASHRAVLEGTHPALGYSADMYLEGSDQHRGWFQSTLLEAAGYKDAPPFKNVLTHGFIVDAQGRKMSKSAGNDIKVSDALKEHGADVLRLWVASVDYHNDMPCSKELLARTGEAYRKVRNTFRYLLGNLYDFNVHQHSDRPARHSIDTWMLGRLSAISSETIDAYEQYDFHRVFRNIYEFCNVDISAIYAKAIKDRLYCELPDSPRRRSSQRVCFLLLQTLVKLCAPVLVFTSDEVWQAIRNLPGAETEAPCVHLTRFADDLKFDAVVMEPWTRFMMLIESGNKQLDELKRAIGLGNALDAEAVIIAPVDEASQAWAHLYGPEIEDALGAGCHRVEAGASWGIRMVDVRDIYPSCARSWKRRPDVGSNPRYPDLSARDARVVEALTGLTHQTPGTTMSSTE